MNAVVARVSQEKRCQSPSAGQGCLLRVVPLVSPVVWRLTSLSLGRDRPDRPPPRTLLVADSRLRYSTKHSFPVRRCAAMARSEEHTSELQSHSDLVCRL